MPVSVSATEAVPSLLDRGERLYSPAGVAKVSTIPGHRGGPHLNGSTIFRFITKGKSVNGEVIRLEAVRVGDRWLTSLEALARFAERLTAAELEAAGAASEAPVSPRQRIRHQEVASRRLDALLAKKK